MAFVEEPISPGGSASVNSTQTAVPAPSGAALDLYRISDRYNAVGTFAPSGNAEIGKKNANVRPQTPNQTGAAKPLSRNSSRSSSSSSPGSGVAEPYESPIEGATCPNPVPFRRSWAEKVTGEVRGEKIELKGCNKKLCPVCGPKLKKRLIGHFARLFSPLPNLVFMTLTLDPKTGQDTGEQVPAEETRMYMSHSWSKFRKRMNRLGEFAYVAVPEQHKDGRTHLHVLVSLPEGVTEEHSRDHWFSSGGGIVMDVQEIETKDVSRSVGYVVKYVFKDAAQNPHKRNMWASAGFSYHSAAHKAARKLYAQELRKKGMSKEEVAVELEAVEDALLEVWEPLTHGRPKGFEDTPTPEQKRRYNRIARSLKRTTLYIHESRRTGRRVLAYYDPRSKSIQTRELSGEITREMLSKEIRQIRALQKEPKRGPP